MDCKKALKKTLLVKFALRSFLITLIVVLTVLGAHAASEIVGRVPRRIRNFYEYSSRLPRELLKDCADSLDEPTKLEINDLIGKLARVEAWALADWMGVAIRGVVQTKDRLYNGAI